MCYSIKSYTINKAKMYGLTVKTSMKKGKKIDVYKDGEYMASIGSIDFSDYPTYLITHNKEYAENRKRLYRCRHSKDNLVKMTPGWLAYNLLW